MRTPYMVHYCTVVSRWHWGLLRPQGRFARAYAIHRLNRLLSRSPLDHVAIEHGGLVLNPLFNGHAIWPSEAFRRAFDVVDTDTVWAERALDLQDYAKNETVSLLDMLRGEESCVGAVCRVLNDAGIGVSRCRHPVEVKRWINQRRISLIEMSLSNGLPISLLPSETW